MKEQILSLRQQGLTYQQIANQIGCAKSTVCYYCGNNQKQKNLQRQRLNRSDDHPYQRKLEKFHRDTSQSIQKSYSSTWRKYVYDKIKTFHRQNRFESPTMNFTVDDVIKKFGENPRCYLTGKQLDIQDTRSYHFDHVIPKSRGGDNSLDNLAICSKEANLAKRDMTPDEFLNFCKTILKHNGYKISK